MPLSRNGMPYQIRPSGVDIIGLPVVKPPWSSITGYNLDTGEIAWKVANGRGPKDHPLLKGLDLPDLGERANAPGLVVTGSLVFHGHRSGRTSTLRALDKATGALVWEHAVEGMHLSAPPMTYMAGGKQFVVLATGSGTQTGATDGVSSALGTSSDPMQNVADFQVVADYRPAGDQPTAIAELVDGIESGLAHQTLLGVTGSGKTFAVANVIEQVQRPTLVLAPNKTLAAQLYGEFRGFFPNNAVEYFVSYYDYYQPEAYVPASDTYIEKDASVNAHIEQMRLSATKALLERRDTVIVASVSAIYGLGDPQSYLRMVLHLDRGDRIDQRYVIQRLAELQYTRNDMAFQRGTYRVRGDVIDVFPAESEKEAVRVELFDDEIDNIATFDPLTGEVIARVPRYTVFPKTHYVTPRERILAVLDEIREELADRLRVLKDANKLVEAQRLEQRTRFDLEMIKELGYCSGIENYSRYLSGRKPGEPPPTLFDYLPKDALLIVDESHVTVPQLSGMYKGDRSRKETLVEYGFRLPSALDNRPLRFDEWESLAPQMIFVSATPGSL